MSRSPESSSSVGASTALHSALRQKWNDNDDTLDLLRAVRDLLDFGHNPAHVDQNGQTAVHVCAAVGSPVQVLQLLIERVSPDVLNQPDFALMTPLHCLLEKNRTIDPACLKCLVTAGASLARVSATKGTPLECLARHSENVSDLFDCLLRIALNDLRRERASLLKTAFGDGSSVFLEALLANWHSLSSELWTTSWERPVFDALSSPRDPEAKTRLVIEYGADPSAEVWPNKETLAHWAVVLGSIPLLSVANDKGVDLSAKNENGQTPLHIAVKGGTSKQPLVDYLVESGVNVDEVDGDDVTALETALRESSRNLDAAASLIRAGCTMPKTELSYEVAVALSEPDVVTRSVNPILTALELGAFMKRALEYVEVSKQSAWLELSDNLVSSASELVTFDNNDAVIEKAITTAVQNGQKRFFLNAKVQSCLNNVFFAPLGRQRRSPILFEVFKVAHFVLSLLLLFARYVSYPFVLLFHIWPRHRQNYDVAATDFLMTELRRTGLVVSYTAQGVSHLYLCILVFFASGDAMAPRHLLQLYLTSFEWLLIVQLVGKIVYELGQLKQQGWSAYVTETGNIWDILIIVLLIISFAMRFYLMSSDGSHFVVESVLAILYAFVFLAVCCRILLYMLVFPYFGPMLISFRQMVYPLLSFLLLFTVFLLAFGVCVKNVYGVHIFQRWCNHTQNASCLTFTEAAESLSLEVQTLWNIIHTLFLGSVGLASTGEMGLSVISNYTVDEVIILLLGVTWLVLSTVILLNMLIALISNAFQNVENNAGIEWNFLKAEIITEMRRSPIVPPPFNLPCILANVIAHLISFGCRKRIDERRGPAQGDYCSIRENLLEDYKAVVEERQLDDPSTRRDIDSLRAEIKEVKEVLFAYISRQEQEGDKKTIVHKTDENEIQKWVSDQLRRRRRQFHAPEPKLTRQDAHTNDDELTTKF